MSDILLINKGNRLALPSSILYQLQVESGSLLEATVKNGQLILSPYYPLHDLKAPARTQITAFWNRFHIPIAVSNTQRCVMKAGFPLTTDSQELSKEVSGYIQRKEAFYETKTHIDIPAWNGDIDNRVKALFPIIKFGKPMGAVMLFYEPDTDEISSDALCCANFIAATISEYLYYG